MRKRIIATALALIAILSLSACHSQGASTSPRPSSNEEAAEGSSFIGGMEFLGTSMGAVVGMDADFFNYYRDTVTDVMYVSFEEYSKGGLTVMLDPATGLPLTHARYLEIFADSAS